MNWTKIIRDIMDTGLTQMQIAVLVVSSQSHISFLYRGGRKQPGWSLGDRLLSLHRERCGTEAKAA